MIDVIKDRPKGDAPENDRTLFVIDDVVTGIDKGFGDTWESFDGDFLVRRRPTADLEVVTHNHPVQVLFLQGFDPFAKKGASADRSFLDQAKKRRNSQSAVRETIRFADWTRQTEVVFIGTHGKYYSGLESRYLSFLPFVLVQL